MNNQKNKSGIFILSVAFRFNLQIFLYTEDLCGFRKIFYNFLNRSCLHGVRFLDRRYGTVRITTNLKKKSDKFPINFVRGYFAFDE